MGEELVNPKSARREPVAPVPAADSLTHSAGEPKRPKPRWWQKLALMSFSLVLLLIAELALRLVGYGPTLDFVVTRLDRGPERIMGINPHAYQRFHGALGPATERTRFAPWREFLDPKPPGHFRVMFLGESTIEGYPHPPNGCAPAFLEAMLQDVWPDRHVEVINCGVTAINTWSIRAWAAEVLRYEPDLLILYAGHNEFYGGYGPASLNAAGTNRSRVLAQIWLSDLRFVRALSDVIGAVRPRSTAPRGTLMERLAREQQIPLDSALYTGCRDNFRANLEDIIRAAQGANVPLLLCGLVSNERDLVPMTSIHREGLSPEQHRIWEEHFNAGLGAAGNLQWARAIVSFEAAARIDNTHAELVYRLAQAHEAAGQYDQARELYRRARDLDALRFRATTEFSEVIREVAERNHALFVDVLDAFDSASPHGLIGWNLMTDHLHPTRYGHYLMARAICETMAGHDQSWPAVDTARLPLYDTLAERLGNDDLSEMVSKISIYKLTENPPFVNSPNAALHERLEREILAWQAQLTGPPAVGHRNWSSAPSWDTLHYHVGRAYLDAGDAQQAIVYFRRAEQMSEPHSLPAARAKVGLACAWLTASNEEERAAGRAYAAELRSWLREARAMHPREQEQFTRLEDELDRALANTSH